MLPQPNICRSSVPISQMCRGRNESGISWQVTMAVLTMSGMLWPWPESMAVIRIDGVMCRSLFSNCHSRNIITIRWCALVICEGLRRWIMSDVSVTTGLSTAVWPGAAESVAEEASMGALEASEHPLRPSVLRGGTDGICRRKASPFIGILLIRWALSLKKKDEISILSSFFGYFVPVIIQRR